MGGRLLSSLLSAYLDIWPDKHCKEGKSDDKTKTLVKEKEDSKKNETDLDKRETGGEKVVSKKHKELMNTERIRSLQTDSCKTQRVGKIQCGRLVESVILFSEKSPIQSFQMQSPAGRS